MTEAATSSTFLTIADGAKDFKICQARLTAPGQGQLDRGRGP